MAIATSLQRLLKKHNACYQVLHHRKNLSFNDIAEELYIPIKSILKVTLFESINSYILAVLPLGHSVNISVLHKYLNKKVYPIKLAEYRKFFFDCDFSSYPPFGEPYGLDIIIDPSVVNLDKIYFSSGCSTSIIEMEINDFLYINSNYIKLDFAIKDKNDDQYLFDSCQKHNELIKKFNIPDLPAVVHKLLSYMSLQDSSIESVSESLSSDSVLQEEIISYFNSAIFKQKLSKLEFGNASKSIAEFVKFDTISHIAIGSAVNNTFPKSDFNKETKKIWLHSIYSGILAHNLCDFIKSNSSKINITLANSYLVGLFHNIGLLFFAKFFYPEFKLLLKWHKIYPKVSIEILEKKLLGMGSAMSLVNLGHASLGAILLEHWNMPEFVVIATKFHHRHNYKGNYLEYVYLMQLVNQLLAKTNLSIDCNDGLNNKVLDFFGISEQEALNVLDSVLQNNTNLPEIAQALTN